MESAFRSPPLIKRGQTCTFQTLSSPRILALTASRLPSMPSFPLSIASTLSELKWAITSPKKGQTIQRYHEEQNARSKGARLSPLDKKSPTFLVSNVFFLGGEGAASFCRRAAQAFPKGGFGGCSLVPKTGTRVHSDVPRYQKPERRYVRMFHGTKNQNKGTFAKTTLLRNRPFVSSLKKSPTFCVSNYICFGGSFVLQTCRSNGLQKKKKKKPNLCRLMQRRTKSAFIQYRLIIT